MKKILLLSNILLLFIIGTQIKAQNYIGLETESIDLVGEYFKLEKEKLFIISPTTGVACIDLKTSNLLGLLPDYDPGPYFSTDYEIFNDKIYRHNMEVFDINTFELIETLPFEQVLLMDVTAKDILTVTADGLYQIINKYDYTDIITLDFNIFSNAYVISLDEGYFVLVDELNKVTVYDRDKKISSFSLKNTPWSVVVSQNYILFEYDGSYEVYNHSGKKLYNTEKQTSSNFYLDGNSDYIYLRYGKGIELVKGNIKSGKEKVTTIELKDIRFDNFFDIIGYFDGRIIVYDRASDFIYKFTEDFESFEYVTKFNKALWKLAKAENNKFDFAVVNSGMYTSLTLIDEHTSDIASINYKSQDKDILFPIYPFEILGNNAYVPVDDNGSFKMLKYNFVTGKYETFGDFGTRVRSIFADEETNRLYVGEYEVYRSSFKLDDNNLEQEYSYNGASYLDITNIGGKVCALNEDFDGMNFIGFESNESVALADGSNEVRYGNQFNYSSNGKYFVSVGINSNVVVHDLINNKEIGRYEVDIDSKIISLAVSNDADFIVIGTQDNGVFEFTPQTNKLVRSKQSKLIPVNNIDGKMIYSKVNGIVINDIKKKYHFIVRDLVFVTADYEVVKTSVESEKVESISDIDLKNLKYDAIKIYDYMGKEIKSIDYPQKLDLENLDVYGPLFFNIINNDNTKTYKYLNTK